MAKPFQTIIAVCISLYILFKLGLNEYLVGIAFSSLLSGHEFTPAADHNIQYTGRWLSSANRLVKEASFPGSSLEFAVFNTTIITLSLLNIGQTKREYDRQPLGTITSLVFTPTELTPTAAGPVDLLVTLNSTTTMRFSNATKTAFLVHNLDPANIHFVKIALPDTESPRTIQVLGLWMSNGGILLHPSKTSDLAEKMVRSNYPNIVALQNTPVTPRRLVEIMAPTQMLSAQSHVLSDSSSYPWNASWVEMLGKHFKETSFSAVPLPEDTCLVTQSHSSKQASSSTPAVTVQDVFFRSGPPGTNMYQRLWPFAQSNGVPSALVLMLGLPDVEIFFTNKTTNKHELTQFIDEFARNYASVVQSIRCTAYSPSTMANIQPLGRTPHWASAETNLDEAYLYNSLPSTMPVFLVLQPLPSSLVISESRQIRSLIQHGNSKVLGLLKRHIGDKHTFIVDTAGWLEDKDFAIAADQGPPHRAQSFTLTQSGHVKMAHHMSLHLCPYLVDTAPVSIGGRKSNGKACPFDQHEEYIGNLYEPKGVDIGKIMQAKKADTIKEIFGVK